jgi:multimeric flavodoxin WrbA
MKVIAFNGSSRRDGNTAILLNAVLGELSNEGIETELIQLAGKAPQGVSPAANALKTKIRSVPSLPMRSTSIWPK